VANLVERSARPRRRRRRITIAAALVLLQTSGANAVAEMPGTELEIAATGDITLGRTGFHQAGGPRQLLGRVARDLRAPVSLGNLVLDANGLIAEQKR